MRLCALHALLLASASLLLVGCNIDTIDKPDVDIEGKTTLPDNGGQRLSFLYEIEYITEDGERIRDGNNALWRDYSKDGGGSNAQRRYTVTEEWRPLRDRDARFFREYTQTLYDDDTYFTSHENAPSDEFLYLPDSLDVASDDFEDSQVWNWYITTGRNKADIIEIDGLEVSLHSTRIRQLDTRAGNIEAYELRWRGSTDGDGCAGDRFRNISTEGAACIDHTVWVNPFIGIVQERTRIGTKTADGNRWTDFETEIRQYRNP